MNSLCSFFVCCLCIIRDVRTTYMSRHRYNTILPFILEAHSITLCCGFPGIWLIHQKKWQPTRLQYCQIISLILYGIFQNHILFRHLPKFMKQKHNKSRNYSTITNVPAPIRMHPISDFIVNSSCKKTNAIKSVSTTLNLSIGTTFEASPICSAR